MRIAIYHDRLGCGDGSMIFLWRNLPHLQYVLLLNILTWFRWLVHSNALECNLNTSQFGIKRGGGRISAHSRSPFAPSVTYKSSFLFFAGENWRS